MQILTITGEVGEENDTFIVSPTPFYLEVRRNGLLQNPWTQYALVINVVKFQPGFIPQLGDTLEARGELV